MTTQVICIFKRNSKCIFKGELCDQDCDRGEWQGNIRSNENLVAECLGKEGRKVALSRKVSNLFFS
ncbi:MAG TPA: hypothetical protein VLK23_13155 [Thermodesulfobacteriota bacterium]|nr:hypothetical protein [Thermodesulfobacteriota bacterium]